MPEEKEELHCAVQASNGLKNLLMDTDITTAIAAAYPAVEKVMLQIQRDVSALNDDDLLVQVAKGLRRIDETLLLFWKEGQEDLAKERDSVRPPN